MFYCEEELKKYEDERKRLCGICELCLTPDSDEFKYCVAMEHQEIHQFNVLELIIVPKG